MQKTVRPPVLTVVALIALGVLACSRTGHSPKVIVVGLDGLTWRFLDPLVKDHQLPNIEGVLKGAAFGEIETFRPTKSGILWTSIATGKTMAKHGITDWTFVDQRARAEIERLRLVTGIDRTAATIWEILSAKGRSVAVTNWWVTYPARPVNGFLITDRLKAIATRKSVPDDPDVVYPPSLIEELRPLFLRPGGAAPTLGKYAFPTYTPTALAELFDTSRASKVLWGALASYVGQDQMVTNWALHLFDKGQPDFFGVVVRITDVFAHFGWRFADRATLERIVPQIRIESLLSEDPTVRDKAQSLIGELDPAVARAMLPSYKFADDFVGAIVSRMDADSILMIVSDHGFNWIGGGYDHNTRSAYPKISPPGVIVLKGKGIRPGRIEGAKVFDVTPTILYAMGEPTGRDMDGRALKDAFLGSGTREERFVQSYGTGAPQGREVSTSREAEKDMLNDLKTLGYIGGEPGGDETKDGSNTDAATSDRAGNKSDRRRPGKSRPKH